MAVVIEPEIWRPNAFIYIFIFVACLLSIFLLPHFSHRSQATSSSSSPFDIGFSFSSSFLRFQRNFLLVYSLSSVMEGFCSVFGEYEMTNYGVGRETMMLSLCAGFAASLVVATFSGMASDFIGQKKDCFLFCLLHLILGIWKRHTILPTVWSASICFSIASTIFSISFETWMVLKHEKVFWIAFTSCLFFISFFFTFVTMCSFIFCIESMLGHRQDALNDTFWLMTFSESAALMGSQILANWVAANGLDKSALSPSTVTVLLAMINMIFIARGCTENPNRGAIKDDGVSFFAYIYGDRRIWLLSCAQACLHFSMGVCWILWAPTIVADGREVNLVLMYPCFMGARMLGSSLFPWFTSVLSSGRIEDYLLYVFTIAGLVLSIVAYDYQILSPVIIGNWSIAIATSLARLRTMYVPNEFCAGMISMSLVPAYAVLLFVVLEGGYYRNLYNSTITAFSAFGHLVAAGCMYMLNVTDLLFL